MFLHKAKDNFNGLVGKLYDPKNGAKFTIHERNWAIRMTSSV